MAKQFPEYYDHLQDLVGKVKEGLPQVMEGFGKLHSAAVGEGTLDATTKELIALGIAISVRCDGCISYHVHDALEAGADREAILETIGVAILMGGGPSLMYGAEALEALEQFTAGTAA